jgi:hypothetical protein
VNKIESKTENTVGGQMKVVNKFSQMNSLSKNLLWIISILKFRGCSMIEGISNSNG